MGSDVCVGCFGFWGFFSLGFLAGGGFQWWWWWFPVWGRFAVEDAKGFLALGLDAMVWLGFMAGGGCSRSEVREGEWGFGCENQRNHQEGE